MLDFGFYNMDCMDGMREFPDKYFELAIVDPPYGDAGGGWTNKERFGQRFDRYRTIPGGGGTASRNTSCHKLGNAGKWSQQNRREMGCEVWKKNNCVGCRAEKGVFRRTFSHLTKSDYMGGGTTSNSLRPVVF